MSQGRLAADEDGVAPLRVGLRISAPFAYSSESGELQGLAVDLWSAIAEEMGVSFELVPLRLPDLLDAVAAGEVDVAVGALSITEERERVMDFTNPFMATGLGIAAKSEPAGILAALRALISWDFLKAVAALAAILFIFGALIWLFERRRNAQFGGNMLEGLGSGFWWSAVTMTTVGYGDKSPITLGGRLIALVWMFGAIILISGFTAAIASSLTVGSLRTQVNEFDDLYSIKVAAVEGSTSLVYLMSRGVNHVPVATVDEGLAGIGEERWLAVVHDKPFLQFGVRRSTESNLRVLPEMFERQHYAFALPLGSELRKPMNLAMLAYLNSDSWKALRGRYLGED